MWWGKINDRGSFLAVIWTSIIKKINGLSHHQVNIVLKINITRIHKILIIKEKNKYDLIYKS